MQKSVAQHQKTQNLLLISKLLECRDNVSPFTLVLDSVEQSARPVLRDIIRRAKAIGTIIIYLSFESISATRETDHLIKAFALDPVAIQSEIKRITTASPASKHLIIIDTLHTLLTTTPTPSTYLTTLLSPISPTSQPPSLLAVYHTDIPLPPQKPYHPAPLTLLSHLATALLTLYAPHHVLARQAANARSVAAPEFGLAEISSESEGGIVQGLGANLPGAVVVEAEVRRRSGREVGVWFALDWRPDAGRRKLGGAGGKPKADVVLFADHPLFASRKGTDDSAEVESGMEGVSFDLGLTEKQRRDREGVVLPYFDAQREGGEVGLGGRILYDMGVEDDFDEEEDEI